MRKIKICLNVCLVLLLSMTATAKAQDITAVDFAGEVIGKVIPDGTAINFKNEIIGQLTADGFLVNSKGSIIGGIVPQGFAVSNDHKYLGKVSSDGTVRLPSGKIAGKVLPNGLVVDEAYNVIASVLSTGIVYDDLGNAVGRLAGNGSYINFEGQNIGFVSPSGYAYKQTDSGYVLSGRLISSKMVVSLSGDFIGSVAPGGKVVDFDSNIIGKIHANGYVYDNLNKVIGRTVKAAYAFSDLGKYLGLVSYNGEVIYKAKTVGKVRADNRVVDLDGAVVGFTTDMNVVALDLSGKYLGYIAPNGLILKGRTVTGHVGPKGAVLNDAGEIIGQLAERGPVFNYSGDLKAEAMPNGHLVSTEGSTLGFMRGARAFDNAGFMVGRTVENALLINSKQDVLGLTGIGSDFVLNSQRYKVSPLGYVYTIDKALTGETLSLAPSYNEAGDLFGYVDMNGQVEAIGDDVLLLKNGGFVTDVKNTIKARQIDPAYTLLNDEHKALKFSQTNEFYNEKEKPVAKLVPEYSVVSSEGKNTLMPVIGEAENQNGMVLNVRGEVVGYADEYGRVFYGNKNVGHMVQNGVAVNNKNVYIGQFVAFRPVVNAHCDVLGVVSSRGDVRSGRDNVIGKVLLNGQAISEVGQSVGYTTVSGPVYGFDGKLMGFANEKGQVLDEEREVIGCLAQNGRLYEDDVLKGHVFENNPVMSFDSSVIGRLSVNNEFIDNKGEISGYSIPDGSVLNDKNKNIGLLFKYKIAFDRQNNFVGYVDDSGRAYDDKNEFFGLVAYDGLIFSKNKVVGYALYDMYIYNENGEVIGYLSKNGTVINFAGQNIGKADRGFLLSKEGRLIGRGNRDYFVRDKQNVVLGEILLSSDVISNDGTVIGHVSNNGDVRDETGKMLATARPLQYYAVKEVQTPSWVENPQTPINVDSFPVPEPNLGYANKVIGVVTTVDGNYLGKLMDDGSVLNDNDEKIGERDENGDIIIGGEPVIVEPIKVDKPEPKPAKPAPFPFMPPNAYGTGEPAVAGPGGGYGPGEPYDPVRSYVLWQAQNARVGDVRVGRLSSDIKASSLTGYQDNWENANFKMSSWRVDMSEMILADKPIPAVLARTIMDGSSGSDVPVTAIVERNVYAEDGRNIVIPAGSRVMGKSGGMGGGGGTSGSAVRVNITWTRLIKPDGSAFEFSEALTGDAQGKGGALGYLDEQLLKIYTLPMATSLMSSALMYVTASGSTTTTSEGSTVQSARAQAAEDARQNFLTNMQDIFQDILRRKTDIEAVTYVPAGTRLIIYPRVDLWLRTYERERSDEYAKEALSKPEQLIDDSDPMGSIHRGGSRGAKISGDNGSTRVVSEVDDTDVQPAQPLIDDGAYNRQRRQRRDQQMGLTPPPPPSTTATGARSGQSGGDNSQGQLF